MNTKKNLLILGMLALISFTLFIKFKRYAFPEYAINFSLTQEQAEQKAITLAQQLNIPITDYKKATLFDINNDEKTYLERELGAKQAGDIAQKDVDIWHFTTRFFKPLHEEEIYIQFAPDGRLVGIDHTVPEDEIGVSLTKEQAQEKANTYLERYCEICKRTGIENWKEIQIADDKKKNRIDYDLVYERQNFKFKEATQRVEITLRGDTLGGYKETLNIPEAWTAQFNKNKSYNEVAQVIAELVNTIAITIPLLIIFFRKFRDKKLKLKIPYYIGLVVAAITIVEFINEGANYYYQYPTDQTPLTIATYVIVGLIISWIYTFITTQGSIATAESQYREVFPEKKDTFFTIKNIFTLPTTTKAVFVGFCVGLCAFTYELLYYVLGRKFGYWVPADVNYSDAFNSLAPWLYPLSIGLLPAISEEALYRLFAIPLYYKYISKFVKGTNKKHDISLILAVIGSALTWAFLHSAYPQMPFFARGLELTIIGIVFGGIFLKYGILASISAHYTFNAMQMAIFFLSAKNSYASISSFLTALLPVWIILISLIIQRIWKKQILTENIPTNGELPQQKEEPPTTEQSTYPQGVLPAPLPLSGKVKVLVFLVTLCSIILVIIPMKDHTSETKDGTSTVKNRSEIRKAAQDFLKQEGINTAGFYSVVTVESNGIDRTTEKYLYQNSEPETIERFIQKNNAPESYWQVRYFRPGQREEIIVDVLPDGEVYTFNHKLQEDAPGPEVSLDEAKSKAREYLNKTVTDPFSFMLIASQADKKQNRIDYSFTFEDVERIHDANRRISFDVTQGVPQNLQSSIRIPDNFRRAESQTKIPELILSIVAMILGLFLLGSIITSLFSVYKQGHLKSTFAKRMALIFTVISIISIINSMPTFFRGYDTDLPLWVHTIFQLVTVPITLIFTYLATRVLLNGAACLYTTYIGELIPPDRSQQKKLFSDALYLVFSIAITALFIAYGSVAIASFFTRSSTSSLTNTSDLLTTMELLLPALDGLKTIDRAFIFPALTIIVLVALRRALKSWKRVIVLVVVLAIAGGATVLYDSEDMTANLITLTPLVVFALTMVLFVIKNNIFYYALVIYFILIGTPMISYLGEEDPFWRLNGALYVILFLLPFIIWWKYDYLVDVLGLAKPQPNEEERYPENKNPS